MTPHVDPWNVQEDAETVSTGLLAQNQDIPRRVSKDFWVGLDTKQVK
jgi:hypothetical protein